MVVILPSKGRKRHDLAIEKYQAVYEKYQEDRTELLDWIATIDREKSLVKQVFENIAGNLVLTTGLKT